MDISTIRLINRLNFIIIFLTLFSKFAFSQVSDSASFYFSKSLASYQVRDFESSLLWINKSLLFNNDNDKAYFRRSLVKEKLHDVTGVFEDLATAIKINPQSMYYNNRGMLFSFRENFQAALFDFNEAIRIDPAYGLSYFNKATALYYQSDLKNACLTMKIAEELKVEGSTEFINEFCK